MRFTVRERSEGAVLALFVAGLALLTGGCAPSEHPDTGASLYRVHCASCHGPEGRGDGPAAPALTPPPTDLTRLTYGVPEIMRQIDGRRTIRAHGSADMPVWGRIFNDALVEQPRQRQMALLHVQWLAEHVQALRRTAP